MILSFCRRLCSKETHNLETEFKELREKFLKMESIRESVVDYDMLTEEEKLIHDEHKNAVKKWHFTYEDPFDNSIVYTRYRHELVGKCCGTACRHCIFMLRNVPEILKKNRRFNTSFWTKKNPNITDTIDLFKDLKISKNIIRKKMFTNEA